MCLHFGLVATNAIVKISLAKHFVFMFVGQDQKFPSVFLFKLYTCTVGCLKWGINHTCYDLELILL